MSLHKEGFNLIFNPKKSFGFNPKDFFLSVKIFPIHAAVLKGFQQMGRLDVLAAL